MIYNVEGDAAWDITLSVSNILNHGQHSDRTMPLDILIPSSVIGAPGTPSSLQVSVRELERTFVNAGVGRDWYLGVPASICGPARCRVGIDVGGRWGDAKIEFNEAQHKARDTGGVYVALHADLECPCGCCTFLYGFRAEWDYLWMHVNGNDFDGQDVNLLIQLGVRY